VKLSAGDGKVQSETKLAVARRIYADIGCDTQPFACAYSMITRIADLD